MIWTDALKDNDAKFEKKNEMTEFVTSNASMSSAMENAPQKAGLGDLFEDFQLKQVMEASVGSPGATSAPPSHPPLAIRQRLNLMITTSINDIIFYFLKRNILHLIPHFEVNFNLSQGLKR